MKRTQFPVFCSWMLALVLVAASPAACACVAGNGAEACRSDQMPGLSRAATAEHSHSADHGANSKGHDATHEGNHDGSCDCSCSLSTPDVSLPATISTVAPMPLLVMAIPAPIDTAFASAAVLKQPGFFGYDSGPPIQSPCLLHQNRAPPRTFA